MRLRSHKKARFILSRKFRRTARLCRTAQVRRKGEEARTMPTCAGRRTQNRLVSWRGFRGMMPAEAREAALFKEEAMAKKSICPITRSQFRDRAKPVTITINDVPMVVPTKEFSTGSFGWYLNGKTVIEIDGKSVQVQL